MYTQEKSSQNANIHTNEMPTHSIKVRQHVVTAVHRTLANCRFSTAFIAATVTFAKAHAAQTRKYRAALRSETGEIKELLQRPLKHL